MNYDSCLSYATCGIAFHIQSIDWVAVGGVVLLIARLAVDVPNAYDSIKKRLKKTKDRNGS